MVVISRAPHGAGIIATDADGCMDHIRIDRVGCYAFDAEIARTRAVVHQRLPPPGRRVESVSPAHVGAGVGQSPLDGAEDNSWDYILALEKEAKHEFEGVKVNPAQYKKLFMTYKNDPAKDNESAMPF